MFPYSTAIDIPLLVRNRVRLVATLLTVFSALTITIPAVEVEIPDPNFEALLRSLLEIPSAPITDTDLASLETIESHSEENQITNLRGIEYATNLKYLILPNQSITALLELNNLTSLEYINLKGNEIADTIGLYRLSNLQNLDLSYNRLVKITSLVNLKQLLELRLSHNQIQSIGALYSLTQIRFFDLSYNFLNLNSGSSQSTIDHLTEPGVVIFYNNQLNDTTTAAPDSASFNNPGGSGTVGVTSNTYWNASSNADWISLSGNTENIFQNSSFDFTVAAALEAELPRKGTISVNGSLVTLIQGEVTEIMFPDETLASAIRSRLDIAPEDPITDLDLQELTDLAIQVDSDAPDLEKIANLSGLQHAKNLTDFSLTNTLITTLDPLSDILSLKSLRLSGLSPQAVANLSDFENLETLAIEYTQLASVPILPNSTSLTSLRLSNTRIADIAALQSHTSLQWLYLKSNHINNIAALANLANLKELNLRYNYLDLSDGNATQTTIALLENQGTSVDTTGQEIDYTSATAEPAASDQSGASGTIEVTSYTYWSASSDSNWITVDSDSASGFQSGSFAFSIAAVPDLTAARTGSITVNGYQLDITQEFITEITFPDAPLETAVRNALNIPSDPITNIDIRQLTELRIEANWDAPNSEKIADLSGLEHAINLESLELIQSLVDNLDPIRELSSLLRLQLSGSSLQDAGDLSKLTSLEWLFITNSKLLAIPPLPVSETFARLDLSGNAISDLTSLTTLTSLTFLYVSNNRIYNLSPLENLTRIKLLGINSNHIQQITPLAKMEALQSVILEDNFIDFSNGEENAMTMAQLTESGTIVNHNNQRINNTSATANPATSDQFESSATVDVVSNTYWNASSNADWITIDSDSASGFQSGSFAFSIAAAPDLTAARVGSIAVNGYQLNITQEFVTEIAFPDELLETAVRDALNIPSEPVTNIDIRQLTELRVEGDQNTPDSKKIANLTGLEYAINLESLELNQSRVDDLDPIRELPSLRRLHLFKSPLQDAGDLRKLTSLEWLSITNSELSAIPLLPVSEAFTRLNLSGNFISDLTSLTTLTSLTILHLSNNRIYNISPLENLAKLNAIDVVENHIREIDPLIKMQALQLVSLEHNFIDFSDGEENAIILIQLQDLGISFPDTSQYSPQISFTPTQAPISEEEQQVEITFEANTYWDASPTADWMSLDQSSGFKGNTLTLTIAANPNLDSRAAEILISGETLTIEQAGLTPDVTLTETSATLSRQSASLSIAVTATTPWRVASTTIWLEITPTESQGNGTVIVNVLPNYSNATRLAKINIGQTSFTITQHNDVEYFAYLDNLGQDSNNPLNWPNHDADKDGLSNRFEYTIGQDPFDDQSHYVFKIAHSTNPQANILTVAVLSDHTSSIIEYSHNLKEWLPFSPDTFEQVKGQLILTHKLSEEDQPRPLFYRQRIAPRQAQE